MVMTYPSYINYDVYVNYDLKVFLRWMLLVNTPTKNALNVGMTYSMSYRSHLSNKYLSKVYNRMRRKKGVRI